MISAFVPIAILQGSIMLIDEFFFHHKRGLPRWERIGHPLDTITVLTCLLFLYFTDPTPTTVPIYYCLAIGSCLFVTKDEWVHWKYCGPAELWLHALLFLLHPALLFTAMFGWESQKENFLMVISVVAIFLVYQIVYWNFIETHQRKVRQKASYARLSKEDLYEYFGE